MAELAVEVRRLMSVFAASVRPTDKLSVSGWAARDRVVAPESNSPYPGPWDNAHVSYLTEIMDTMGFDHPAQEVAVLGSAQSAKSEAGVNAIGSCIVQDPSPILVVLPSLDEARKYNTDKIDATIEATPALRQRVMGLINRDESGSTIFHKRFRGGSLRITTASSSKGLQMVSARMVIFEEIVEYPEDVDGRGSPIDQAENRLKAWLMRGVKKIYISTAGLEGSCPITARYKASDQRKLYVPCPQCGDYQLLTWERMGWASDEKPHRAYFACASRGCPIEEPAKRGLIAAGQWIKTYPSNADEAPGESFPPEELAHWKRRGSGGRYPGFFLWQAYSPFVPWEATVAEHLAAEKKGLAAIKAFHQQALARAWKVQGEAPKADELLARRQAWPVKQIPPGVLFLTGATDVHGNRLEWAVWGWDRRLGGYLIDFGVLEGDPNQDDVWLRHDALLDQRYADAWGKTWPVDRWAVDSGYLSTRVYMYARRHAPGGRILAVDGRKGWKLPPIGAGKQVRFQLGGRKVSATIYPVGTYDLKSELYTKMQLTRQGPDQCGVWPAGCIRLPMSVDLGYVEQLTAEYVMDQRTRTGQTTPVWVQPKGRPNEALDIAVYALALAHRESDGLSEERWQRLAEARLGPPEKIQTDLADMWAEPIRHSVQAPRLQPLPMRRSGADATPARPRVIANADPYL